MSHILEASFFGISKLAIHSASILQDMPADVLADAFRICLPLLVSQGLHLTDKCLRRSNLVWV